MGLFRRLERWSGAVATVMGVCLAAAAWARGTSQPLGLGRAPTAAEIRYWDISIGPDGRELPPGRGDAREGQTIYLENCAACHGETGREGPRDALAGGRGSLTSAKPLKTIGSYWPYATTIYDYVRRAMPYYNPGSLKPDEVYAIVAYLLYLNGVIHEHDIIDANTLPKIKMPNRDGFHSDPRPDVSVGVYKR